MSPVSQDKKKAWHQNILKEQDIRNVVVYGSWQNDITDNDDDDGIIVDETALLVTVNSFKL